MVCLVINEKIYYLDGEVAGTVIDLIFRSDGRIAALIASKIIFPIVRIGLINTVLPYNMVRMIKSKYYILLPKSLLANKKYCQHISNLRLYHQHLNIN